MKKINIIAGIIVLCMFIWHSAAACTYLLGITGYSEVFDKSGRILFTLAFLHIVINVAARIKVASRTRNLTGYPSLWVSTYLQNRAGYFIIGLMPLHLVFAEITKHAPSAQAEVARFVIESLFYVCLSIHICYAVEHMLITFGIITDKKRFGRAKIAIAAAVSFALVMLVIADGTYNLRCLL